MKLNYNSGYTKIIIGVLGIVAGIYFVNYIFSEKKKKVVEGFDCSETELATFLASAQNLHANITKQSDGTYMFDTTTNLSVGDLDAAFNYASNIVVKGTNSGGNIINVTVANTGDFDKLDKEGISIIALIAAGNVFKLIGDPGGADAAKADGDARTEGDLVSEEFLGVKDAIAIGVFKDLDA